MPLEKLYEYRGLNECPADIDAYWDHGIAEMEALGTGFELVESEYRFPGVECFELFFTGVGGARIHCRLARPARREGKLPGPCVFHGYSGSCGQFSDLLKYVAAGFVAVSMSCRGQGGISEDVSVVKGNTLHGHIIRGLDDADPRKLYYYGVYLDTVQLVRIAMAMDCVDETRVGAYGGSQGGGLTLACAALTPTLNRAAPTYPFLCDYKRVWEMDLARDAYHELREYFRFADPLHEREDEIFTLLGYIDNQHLAHRIRARVRMFTGLMDSICPPSTQFAAYNKMVCEKDVVIYPDFGHEGLPESGDKTMAFLLEM
jgi:cephalosporin-C deacetylase